MLMKLTTGKKAKVSKRDTFADQLASIVETDVHANYDDEDSSMEQIDQTEPLVRFLPSGIN